MNSKQVNFFIIPTDLQEVTKLLREKDCLFILKYVSAPQVSIIDHLKEASSNKIYQVCLSKGNFLDKIYFQCVDRDRYFLDDTLSYVIEFSLGGFFPYSDRELNRSRLYYIKKYYDADGNFVSKSEEFITWADEMISTIKKTFLKKSEKYSNNYFSANCLAWLEDRDVKLVENQGKIIIS